MLCANGGGPGPSQGAGTGPAGLTGIRVSEEGVLVLAASQRDGGRGLVLRQPREAGDAHVVHRRVGAQGAFLTGLVLCRHPRPRPPAALRLPEVLRRGRGAEPEFLNCREGAPHPDPWKVRVFDSCTPPTATLCLALPACVALIRWNAGVHGNPGGQIPVVQWRVRREERAVSTPLETRDNLCSPGAKPLSPSSMS